LDASARKQQYGLITVAAKWIISLVFGSFVMCYNVRKDTAYCSLNFNHMFSFLVGSILHILWKYMV